MVMDRTAFLLVLLYRLKEFHMHWKFDVCPELLCRFRYLGLHGTSPVKTVTAPAHPVQIRAHHHIDFYTDINKLTKLVIVIMYLLVFQTLRRIVHRCLIDLV